MKIKNIKINQYGTLANKEIALTDQINLIYGKNESGKSTLLNYIKSIFYGISKKKNGKDISDYEKYTPWMKQEFSGRLQYELDNGEAFEIFRDFHHKNPKIFNGNLEEISKEFTIDKKDGNMFFSEQTNVDEKTFLSTIVSMQQEVRLETDEQSILLQKLANLAGTGDDNVYFQKTLDRLNKKQLEIGTDRTQGKPINRIQNTMKELSIAMKDKQNRQEDKILAQEKKKETLHHIQELMLKKDIYMKINELNIQNNIEEEKIKLKNKMKSEAQEKINALDRQKNNIVKRREEIHAKQHTENKQRKGRSTHQKEKISPKKYILLFLGTVLISLFLKIGNMHFIKNSLLDYFIDALPVIGFITFLLLYVTKQTKYQKENRIKEELEKRQDNNEILLMEKQIHDYQQEILKQEEEIKTMRRNMDANVDNTIEQIKNDHHNVDIDAILETIDVKRVKEDLEAVQENLNNEKIMLNTVENEENNITSQLENQIALEEEYKNLEEELQTLEEESKCILLTKAYLSKAYETMKNTITPKFTENLSKTIAVISNQKYRKSKCK